VKLGPTATLPVDGGGPEQQRELRAQGQKTMRKLLDAGRWVFDKRGFHAARVDDVVKRAKTSHGTFYLYFSNKEGLFKALAIDALDDMGGLVDQLPEITPDSEGRGALRGWISLFFDTYARHGSVIRAWTEGEFVDNELGALGSQLLGRLGAALRARVEAGGPSEDVDPAVAGLALLSLLERFNYLVQSRQVRFEREAMLDTLAAVAHAGFFTGQPMVGMRSPLRSATRRSATPR